MSDVHKYYVFLVLFKCNYCSAQFKFEKLHASFFLSSYELSVMRWKVGIGATHSHREKCELPTGGSWQTNTATIPTNTHLSLAD